MYKHFTAVAAMISFGSAAQQAQLQSGPMLGYAEMKEAVVWLQTTAPASVYAVYDDLSTERNEALGTDTIKTAALKGNTAKLFFRHLRPGKTYAYRIFIDHQELDLPYDLNFTTQSNWQYRTDPPDFKMALGSCSYISEEAADRPGEAYGSEYQIFPSILEKAPDAMLWLGDNTYLRPADWWSRSGYLHRYTHTRSLPEMQNLLASCNHFAIWDDHDFGPNDISGSWIHKELALEMFKLFWANPTFGYPDLPGIMTGFAYSDVHFILMDNRYHRTANFDEGEKHIFGRKQSDRMIDLLKNSNAPFKIVATGGQFLNSAAVYETHANFTEEREYILQRIEEENIKGVIFISGDRHHSEVMEMELENGNTIWEFTVSPLTSGPSKNVTETNDFRVDGSLIEQRNFAVMEVTGQFRDRHLQITFFDSNGKKLFDFNIPSKDIYGE